jgi:hypothetical protein
MMDSAGLRKRVQPRRAAAQGDSAWRGAQKPKQRERVTAETWTLQSESECGVRGEVAGAWRALGQPPTLLARCAGRTVPPAGMRGPDL